MRWPLVDSSAWYAFIDRRDPFHAEVTAALRQYRPQLLLTDYIFDETITLIRYRLGWSMAYRLGEGLRSGTFATLIPLLDADTDAAWTLFGQRADQRLSFTDCTSYVLMRRLRLPAMITLDADFKALGLQTLP